MGGEERRWGWESGDGRVGMGGVRRGGLGGVRGARGGCRVRASRRKVGGLLVYGEFIEEHQSTHVFQPSGSGENRECPTP